MMTVELYGFAVEHWDIYWPLGILVPLELWPYSYTYYDLDDLD